MTTITNANIAQYKTMKTSDDTSKVMQYAGSFALAAATVWLTGCASAPRVATMVDPVGPASSLADSGSGDGLLLVYSAQRPAFVDVGRDEYAPSSASVRGDTRYEAAHTGYTVYSKTGEVIRQVPNATDQDDGTPSIVGLHSGNYRVEAEAVNCDGSRITVVMPVVIRAGQTTEAHLEGGWHPAVPDNTQLAKLPCGRVIGWRASNPEVATAMRP
jgi:hypothetical protein